ncbi:MAG: hypothetical protein AB7P31_12155 [Steroidobacteraceae bacterium]
MPTDEAETSAPTNAETDALSRLLRAAADLANLKLGSDLADSEYADALRSGAASLEFVIELPRGRLAARARYPAMSSAPIDLFEVVPPVRRTTDA